MVDWSNTKRKHGTRSGYLLHLELGEEACGRCKKANSIASHQHRTFPKVDWSTTKRKHGTVSGYQLHAMLKEKACGKCLKAWRSYYDDKQYIKKPRPIVSKAQSRARSELVRKHRDEYSKIYQKHIRRLMKQAQSEK